MPRANKELHSGQPQYGLNNSIPRIEGVGSDVSTTQSQIIAESYTEIQKSNNIDAEFGLEQQVREVGKIDTDLLIEYRNDKLSGIDNERTYIEKYQKIVSDWYDEFHKGDKKVDKFFTDESDNWLERVEKMLENKTKSKDQSIFISKKEKHEEGKVVDNTDEILDNAVDEVQKRIEAMLECGMFVDENSIQVILGSVFNDKLKAKLANVTLQRVFQKLNVQNLVQLNENSKFTSLMKDQFNKAMQKMFFGQQTSKELTMDSIMKIIEKAIAGSLDQSPEGKMKIIYETCKFYNIRDSVMYDIADKVFSKNPIIKKEMMLKFKEFVAEMRSPSLNKLMNKGLASELLSREEKKRSRGIKNFTELLANLDKVNSKSQSVMPLPKHV